MSLVEMHRESVCRRTERYSLSGNHRGNHRSERCRLVLLRRTDLVHCETLQLVVIVFIVNVLECRP